MCGETYSGCEKDIDAFASRFSAQTLTSCSDQVAVEGGGGLQRMCEKAALIAGFQSRTQDANTNIHARGKDRD